MVRETFGSMAVASCGAAAFVPLLTAQPADSIRDAPRCPPQS